MTPEQAREWNDYCLSRVRKFKNSSLFLEYLDLAYDKMFKEDKDGDGSPSRQEG